MTDIVGQLMPEDQQEEMCCFTMGDCELHSLKPKHNRQEKQCEFMRASIHVTSMLIDSGEEDGSKVSIPIVVVSNDDYDDGQEQIMEEKLPLTEELIFMKYTDGADFVASLAQQEESKSASNANAQVENIRAGYVFFYPSLGLCKVVEVEVSTELQFEELRQFEEWVCKVLYVTNEQVPIHSNLNLHAQAKQEKIIRKYCIGASLDVLLRQTDINDIFTKPMAESPQTSAQTSQEESKEPAQAVPKTHVRKVKRTQAV